MRAEWSVLVVVAGVLVVAPALGQEAPLAVDRAACPDDWEGPTVTAVVTGFEDRKGRLRVELYPATPEDFLAPGRKLRAEGKVFERIDIEMPGEGDGRVCVPLPHPGPFALAVLHDRNADGKLNPFSDGFGFPNNPRLGFGKPDVADVTFVADAPTMKLTIVLNYWNGLAARPVRK